MRDRGRALRAFVGATAVPARHASLLRADKPSPAVPSSYECSPFPLDSLSFVVRHRVPGYAPLPAFAETQSDASLRTPDEQFAEFVLDVHGLDMKGPPPPLPEIVYDSRG